MRILGGVGFYDDMEAFFMPFQEKRGPRWYRGWFILVTFAFLLLFLFSVCCVAVLDDKKKCGVSLGRYLGPLLGVCACSLLSFLSFMR